MILEHASRNDAEFLPLITRNYSNAIQAVDLTAVTGSII